jgi:hypothetical protein
MSEEHRDERDEKWGEEKSQRSVLCRSKPKKKSQLFDW